MNKTKLTFALLAVTIGAGTCLAQADAFRQKEPAKAYQLDFVLKELEDGKVINSRNFSMMMTAAGAGGSIRTGDKVPVVTKSGPASETTYIDVGVNIDCGNVQESDGKLTLNVKAESSAAQPDSSRPLIRNIKWSSSVVLPLRKATVLFSSDDNSSKKRTQLELTATPVN